MEGLQAKVEQWGCAPIGPRDRHKILDCAVDGFSAYPLFRYLCGGEYSEKVSARIWRHFVAEPREYIESIAYPRHRRP